MGLLSTNIAKVKRLSLREVKLPAPELRVEPVTPIQVEGTPTDEEIAYSKLVAIKPLIEELVERLDLVSINTGDRIKRVELREGIKPHPEPEIEAQEIGKDKLTTLAHRVVGVENNITKDEIIARIKEATNVSQERAEKGFNLILQAGVIKLTPADTYYLTGSTPF